MTKYEIAANVMLENVDGFEGRMTAGMQRKVFGRAIFGKKTIKINADGQGEVTGRYSTAFGTDSVFFAFSFERIANLANNPDTPVNF